MLVERRMRNEASKGQPADNGFSNTGVSLEMDYRGLDGDQYLTASFPAGGMTVSKLIAAWPSEVDFEDGRKWYARKKQMPWDKR